MYSDTAVSYVVQCSDGKRPATYNTHKTVMKSATTFLTSSILHVFLSGADPSEFALQLCSYVCKTLVILNCNVARENQALLAHEFFS